MATKTNYYSMFRCPVCKKWVSCINISGVCPHCGSEGFKTVKAREEKLNRKGVKNGE